MDVPVESSNGQYTQQGQGNLAIPKVPVGKLISLPEAESPSFMRMHVRLFPDTSSPKPGNWLSIEVNGNDGMTRCILGRVLNSWEHNPHEDAQSSTVADVLPIKTVYAPEGESTVIYRVAEIEPMEEVLLNQDGTIAIVNGKPAIYDVSTLPRAGTFVYEANQGIIIAALGLEDNGDEGIVIGTLRGSGNPPTPAIIKRSAVQRHIFIGGGIGAGKSYTRGVLAEELHLLGVPQINIDVNGELVEATNQLGGINLRPGKDGFTLPLSALTAQDVTNAIPAVNRGTNIETLIQYSHEALLKSRTLANGEHFSVDDLVARIPQDATDLNMGANSSRPAQLRAESLNRIDYIGEPFDWQTHIKPGALINIDCRGLLVSDLRLIVASIARDLQRLAKKKDNLFVVFSIDEFHLVAPNDDSTVTTQVLRELARIGRHYKIGLILTTQSPQDVDRSILKRLLTRFLHSIEPDQLDALRGVFSDASSTLISSLPKLPQGTCIVTGAYETIRHASVVDVRQRDTIHGGETPDIWKDFAKQGWVGKKSLTLKEEAQHA
jgi:hypothetical protein